MRAGLMALTLAASLLGALDPVAWAERIGYRLDAWQATGLRDDTDRKLYNVSRQGGKSTLAGLDIAHRTAHGQDGYTALVTGPSERQGLELLRKVAEPLHRACPEQIVAEGATHITLTRDRRVLAVPPTERTIRGFTVHDLALDEAARLQDALYRAVRPMLAVSGGRLLALSTPYGRRGFFYQEWVDARARWTRYEVPWTQIPRITPAFIAEERESAKRQGLDPELWIAQEYECAFLAAIQGSYYGRLLESARQLGRIGAVPYDPLRGPVSTAWDLGVANPAVWFYQTFGPAVYVLAYREPMGAGLDGYAGLLRSMPFAENYREHAWPHDGGKRSEESGLALATAGEAVGIKPIRIIPRTTDIDQDIQEVKSLLPRCYFDAQECGLGLEGLAFYHTEYDEDRRTFKPKPEHDWSSHPADAFRTLAKAIKGQPDLTARRQVQADPGDDPYAYRPPTGPRQLYAES